MVMAVLRRCRSGNRSCSGVSKWYFVCVCSCSIFYRALSFFDISSLQCGLIFQPPAVVGFAGIAGGGPRSWRTDPNPDPLEGRKNG